AKTGAGCGDNYAVSQTNWMVYGPFSLKRALDADVNLKLWLNAVAGEDGVFIGASINGQNFYGNSYTGGTFMNKAPQNSEWNAATNKFSIAEAGTQNQSATQVEWAQLPLTAWRGVHFDLTNVYQLGDLRRQPKVWV